MYKLRSTVFELDCLSAILCGNGVMHCKVFNLVTPTQLSWEFVTSVGWQCFDVHGKTGSGF